MDQTQPSSLTLNGLTWPRVLSFLSGLGMAAASVLTIRHFFMANYPATIFTGSFCDISAFFNCDSSAFSPIAQVFGVPLGYFGLFMGALVMLGAVIPSPAFERTNKFLSLLNVLGVAGLFLYSVLVMHSLCLLCSGYYLFSILSFVLFWRYGLGRGERGFLARWVRPSFRLLVVFGVVALAGAYGFLLYNDAKKEAQVGQAANIVRQYYELPKVAWPSLISPYWSVKSTERFEDAPIQVVEYADFLCPDCLYLAQQLDQLKKEFAGKINVAVQFFPLEGSCNKVLPAKKANLHPGACEMTFIAAGNLERFPEINDEIWANFRSTRNPEWRRALAKKYGTEGAMADPKVRDLVERIINTGAEYEKTSEGSPAGIRSTPTMIINNRMVIGTLPYQHMKAIFQALVDERQSGGRKFIENWMPPARKKK
ncbi:MAG TPA: vitamin K epoxide reductase family protein [Terriglobales bacterium]|nr:vitamin K epoxide reductase family protein [Terriglobales bacterium]